MMAVLLVTAARAECPDPRAAVADAETAAQEVRLDDAEAALTRFEEALPCAWVDRALMARFWNAEGAWLHHGGDPAAARASFGAARRIDPDAFDANYGTKLRDVWAGASVPHELGEFALSPTPPPGSVRLDGRVMDAPWEVSAGAHVLQVGYGDTPTTGSIQVLAARSVTSVELMDVPRPLAPRDPVAPVPDPGRAPTRDGKARRGVLIASVAGAGTGAVLLGVAGFEQMVGIPKARDLPALETARRRQVGCGIAGYTLLGLGAAGVGVHLAL